MLPTKTFCEQFVCNIVDFIFHFH